MCVCYSKELPEMLENEVLLNVAEKHDKTAAQVLLRFLIQKDIVVIPKSTNPERLTKNIQVVCFIIICPDADRIKGVHTPRRYC